MQCFCFQFKVFTVTQQRKYTEVENYALIWMANLQCFKKTPLTIKQQAPLYTKFNMVGVTTSQTPTNITNINLCNSTLRIQTNKSDDKNKSTSKHAPPDFTTFQFLFSDTVVQLSYHALHVQNLLEFGLYQGLALFMVCLPNPTVFLVLIGFLLFQ